MPTYDYVCRCGNRFEEVVPVVERDHVLCPRCSDLAVRQFSAPTVTVQPSFKEGWDYGLGKRVESREQRKRIMREQGAEEA